MVKRFSITDARKRLAEIVNMAAQEGERVILSRHGRDLVVIVPIEDAEALEYFEDREGVIAAKRAMNSGGSVIDWEDAKKRLRSKA